MASIKYDNFTMKFIYQGKVFDTVEAARECKENCDKVCTISMRMSAVMKKKLDKLCGRYGVNQTAMIGRLIEKEYEVIYGKENVGA